MAYTRQSTWGMSRNAGITYYVEGRYPPMTGSERHYYKPFKLQKGVEMQETAQTTESRAVVNFEEYAMTPDRVIKQVQLIQQVMEKAMQENEHFGKIPGTNKPTLLKAGAEKLCLTFRLDPDYKIIREVRESDFIAYTVKCDLTHIPTGQSIASGIGSCNSRETKYRWRNIENPIKPLKEVPKSYWKDRNKQALGGKDYKPWKNPEDGKWYVATVVKVENDNPWDLDNTLIKMACKRALVAATLNATAASDIFTQDLEDMPDIANGKTEDKAPKKESKKEKTNNGNPTATQVKKIFELGAAHSLSREETTQIVEWFRAGDRLTGKEAFHLISRMEGDFDNLLDEFMEAKAADNQETLNQTEELDDIPI